MTALYHDRRPEQQNNPAPGATNVLHTILLRNAFLKVRHWHVDILRGTALHETRRPNSNRLSAALVVPFAPDSEDHLHQMVLRVRILSWHCQALALGHTTTMQCTFLRNKSVTATRQLTHSLTRSLPLSSLSSSLPPPLSLPPLPPPLPPPLSLSLSHLVYSFISL